MANIKISQLTAAAAASGTQEFEVNDTLVSKKVTGDQVKAFVKSGFVASDISDVTSTAAELNKLTGVTTTATELNHLAGSSTTLAAPLLANPQNYVDPENRIINGAFDFWQRGTSFSGFGYSADRWVNSSAGGTTTVSQQAFALGDTLGSNNPTYFLRQTVSGQTGADVANILQRIEDARTYAGQTVTILGWARRSSGAGNMRLFLFRDFGTGGTPSSAETAGDVNPDVTLSTSWQPFAATISVSSVTGKTLGTNGNSSLSLGFSTSGGVLGSLQTIGVDLWGIHIKLGVHTADATALYKQPELGPELARCQRYYETGGARWRAVDSNGTTVWTNYFKVTKRGLPTMAGDTAIGGSLLNTSAFSLQRIASGYVDTGVVTWTADAEL